MRPESRTGGQPRRGGDGRPPATDKRAAEKRATGDRTFIEEARRAQILRAAVAVIAEEGYARASFARIAERAGISAGLISYHFAGKDELMTQVVTEVTGAMDRAMTERSEGTRSYRAALRALVEAFVLFCDGHRPEILALGQVVAGKGGPSGDGFGAALREDSVASLARMFRDGRENGEFRDFDDRLMAVTVLGAFNAVPSELYSRPDTDVDAYARELAETVDRAVRKGRKGVLRGG